MKLYPLAILAAGCRAAALFGSPQEPQDTFSVAPLHTAAEPAGSGIFLVKFRDNVDASAMDAHRNAIDTFCETLNVDAVSAEVAPVFGITKVFNLFNGYAVRLPMNLVNAIRRSPLIEYVEEDSVQYVSTQDIEKNSPWGLARLSSRNHTTDMDYFYDAEGGKGVTVYIIDTGVYEDHHDFEGRAKLVAAMGTLPLTDDHGHGSHCAGTAIGKKYGVAKKGSVASIKVCDYRGSCMTSDIISGIEFAVNMHDALSESSKDYKGGVISMSLGGGPSPTQDLALKVALEKHNLLAAVAAGNEMDDACGTSPARGASPITVGATDVYDWKAYFSNDGSCVDIFAPGVNIKSVGLNGKDDYDIMSGTSMATPHVAGLAAYFLSLKPKSLASSITATDLKKKILAFGTRGVVKGKWSNGPDNFAFNGAGLNLTEFWGASTDAQLDNLHGQATGPSGLEAYDKLRALGHETAEAALEASSASSAFSFWSVVLGR